MSPNVTVAFSIGEAGIEESYAEVPEAMLCSVLDMSIHADHHVQAAGLA